MAYEIMKLEDSRPIQGVLFDMDGLVLDTECLYSRFWMEASLELGYPMTYEQSLGLRSLNRVRGQAYLTSIFGPGIDYEAVRLVRIRRMDAWVETHGVAPKPGIRELLRFLQARMIPCAITTSSPLDRVRQYLAPLGLLEGFDVLCSGREVPHGKPEPDIYLLGARRIERNPQDCLALEDSPAGIESAFRAGCLPVVIPDQDQPDAETLSRTFGRADTLADICGLLEKLNG